MEQLGFGPKVMRNIRICPDCGKPSPAEKERCACGSVLSGETLFQQYQHRHRFCRRCDMVVANDAKFCPECGGRI